MLTTGALRLLTGAFAAALATCSTPPRETTPSTPPPVVETPAEAEAEVRTFDPDIVRPAPGGAVAQIRRALDSEDADAAVTLSAEALAQAGEAELHRLFWLNARATRMAGTPARSFATLENISTSEHPLAPWARLDRARIVMEVDAERAAAEVEPLTEMDWAGQRDARNLYAAARVETGDADEAEPLLRALLAESPNAARATVAMPLAELLAARDDDAAKEEAIALLRRVTSRAPLSSRAGDAERRIRAILAELPAARRRALRDPSPQQAFERAEALARAVRFEEAEQAFHAVAERAEDEGLRCRARFGEGRAIYYRRHRRRAAEHLSEVGHECEAAEVRAWSWYLAGKGYQSADEPELALAQYALVEEHVASHSLADDSRYRAALIEGERGDEDAMVRRLAELPERYPEGDMRGRARFMLAWRARRADDREEALRQLDALIAEGIGEDREDLAGRARYWRGCVLNELERGDEGRDAWTGVVREAPLSYYAQQAIVRLDEVDEASARHARGLLGGRGDREIHFPWREELDSPAFIRAVELMRVGEVERAGRELTWLEAQASDDPDALEQLRWIHAALLDRAGAYPQAVHLTRRRLRAFMEAPPEGDHYARWRIAYPRAYAQAIEHATATVPVPAELVFAIAREESSFRPDVVSVAHAYGLTQLLVPTARRFARPLDLRANARTLRDPVVNVRIGAAFMSWLWERYESNPVVLPSAYNAGQGATDRWLRERPDQRLDEWIEEIPYDETRRYTRRVLQTWGIYTWLDRGQLPPLRAELPRR